MWRYKKELEPAKREKFEAIFGKLTHRFTATHWYTEFDGEKSSGPYWVVASDSRSVVVAYREDHDPHLQQIFFEEGYMYVFFPTGYNVEFFRRVTA